jgi:hypothetical protein
MEASPDIAARIEGRLERLELTPDQADRLAALQPGTTAALLRGEGALPRGNALRRFAEALDVAEEFVLGLEPGDLIPAEMLEERQGELGLLAPDEEALLRNYRRLDVPARAAFALVLARAAGPEPVPPAPPLRRRSAKRG